MDMTTLDDSLARLQKASDFIKKLNSQAFKNFLFQRVKQLTSNPVIFQNRIPIAKKPLALHPATQGPVALYYSPESNTIKVHNEYVASYPEEVSYDSAKFYHDGVLSGGVISALAQEFLLGKPVKETIINYSFYSRTKKKKAQVQGELELLEDAFAYHTEKEFIVEECSFNQIYAPDRDKDVNWTALLMESTLNCDTICFHPISKEVFYLPDFLQFLLDEKREIKILKRESSITPGTLAKAQLRAHELDARFYLGDAVRKIITSELSDPSEGWGILKDLLEEKPIKLIPFTSGKPIINNQLTPKEFELLDKNPEILMPYLSYNKESQTLNSYINFPLVNYLKSITKKSSWLKAKKNKVLNWYCLRAVLRTIKPEYPDCEVEAKYYDRTLILIDGFERFFKQELERPFNTLYIITNENNYTQIKKVAAVIKADLQEEQFFSLLDKIKGHSKLFGAMLCFLEEGWTFAQTDLFLRNLVNLGLTEIGAFEEFLTNAFSAIVTYKTMNNFGLLCNFSPKFVQPILFKDHNNETLLAKFKEVMIEWHEFNREKNTLRPTLKLGAFKSKVKELVLATELNAEGQRMSHCVGGYAEKVRSRQCRIFHLEHKGEKATLEILMNSPTDPGDMGLGDILLLARRMNSEYYMTETTLPSRYRVGQMKSFANSEPSKTLKALARLLTNYLALHQSGELPKPKKKERRK